MQQYSTQDGGGGSLNEGEGWVRTGGPPRAGAGESRPGGPFVQLTRHGAARGRRLVALKRARDLGVDVLRRHAHVGEQRLEHGQLLGEQLDLLAQRVVLAVQLGHFALGVPGALLGLLAGLAHGDVVALAAAAVLVGALVEQLLAGRTAVRLRLGRGCAQGPQSSSGGHAVVVCRRTSAEPVQLSSLRWRRRWWQAQGSLGRGQAMRLSRREHSHRPERRRGRGGPAMQARKSEQAAAVGLLAAARVLGLIQRFLLDAEPRLSAVPVLVQGPTLVGHGKSLATVTLLLLCQQIREQSLFEAAGRVRRRRRVRNEALQIERQFGCVQLGQVRHAAVRAQVKGAQL